MRRNTLKYTLPMLTGCMGSYLIFKRLSKTVKEDEPSSVKNIEKLLLPVKFKDIYQRDSIEKKTFNYSWCKIITACVIAITVKKVYNRFYLNT